MRKFAFALSLIFVATACRSTSPSDTPADAQSGDAQANGAAAEGQAAEARAAGDAFARDAQTLSVESQQKVFMVEEHIARAQRFAHDMHFDEALAELDAALQIEPDSLKAKQLRNEVRSLKGDPVASQQTVAEQMAAEHELKIQRLRAEAQDSLRKAKTMIARNEYAGAIAELELTNNLVRFAPYSINWEGADVEAKNLLESAKATQAQAEASARMAKEQQGYERLKTEEENRRRALAAKVSGTLDRAISAFQIADYEEAHSLAKQALEQDPRNEQAREIKDASFRALKTQVRQDYVQAKNEQFRRWQESMRELVIPYTEVITNPDREEWQKMSDVRSKRRGLDLSAKLTETERALRDQLRTTLLSMPPIQEQEKLSAVVDVIATLTGLPIVVDPAADNAARDAGKVFTLNLEHRVSVEQALNLICSMTGDGVDNPVTWTVRHDVVFVTTKEKARGKPIPVNHDVQDLNFALTDFIGPRIDRIRLIDQLTDDDGGGPFATVGEHPQLITPEDLSVLVQENVAVNTWSQEGYSIEAAAGYLLINHTPEVQEQVRQFLNDLRRFNSSLVTIESKFMTVGKNWIQEIGVDFRGLDSQLVNDVSNGLEDMASLGLDNGGTGTEGQNAAGHPSAGIFYNDGQDGNFLGTTQNFFENPLGSAVSTVGGLTYQLHYLNDLELSAILRAVEKSTHFELINDQILSVHNTQRAYVTVLNQRAYIQDFDVEVAQFQAVADPQINVLHEGVVLDVRPTIHSDRKYLTLEIQPTVAKLIALRNFSSTLGGNTSPVEFQLPEIEVQSVFTTAIIPDGGSIMLGGLSSVRNIERRAEVPWLARIPIVGFFFKQEGYNDENKSLMILIRARITDVYDEIKKIEKK
jgi:Flp pilus assembly secretin CpaC/tetratricopeptide (TPR) repeat protein